MKEKWIDEAVEKPGALRSSAMAKYGKKAFKAGKGNIKPSFLRAMAKAPGKMGKRGRLAQTLGKLPRE